MALGRVCPSYRPPPAPLAIETCGRPAAALLSRPPPAMFRVPPVVSSALTSASSSRVSRVTSLPGGVRALRPLPFREESHLRWMKVTWQSEQDAAPGGRPCHPRCLLGVGKVLAPAPTLQPKPDTPHHISDCLHLPSLSVGECPGTSLGSMPTPAFAPALPRVQGPGGFRRSH